MRTPASERRMWLRSVVFPLPRKPVRMVTGTGSMVGGTLCRYTSRRGRGILRGRVPLPPG